MIALRQAKLDGLWSRQQFRPNLVAGLIVGIVALPLAMAFAIASGARPEQGLLTEPRPNVRYKLERAGIVDLLGGENIFDTLQEALDRASASLDGPPSVRAGGPT